MKNVSIPIKSCFLLALAYPVLALFTGCGPTRIQPALISQLDPAYMGSTIQVDLVGINTSQLAVWQGKRVNEYFAPNDPFRASAIKQTLAFGGETDVTTLSANDPIWATWTNAANQVNMIVVIADLPGYTADQGVDLRKQFIPLSSDRWDGVPKQITMRITPTGVILLPAPKLN